MRLSIDLELKWRLRDNYRLRRGSRSASTFKRCSKKMNSIRKGKRMRRSRRDSKTSRLKKSTLKCLKSKSKTE